MAAFYVLNTDASIGPSRKAAIGVVLRQKLRQGSILGGGLTRPGRARAGQIAWSVAVRRKRHQGTGFKRCTELTA